MTQEEKDLLMKDLCARLPYGVIVKDEWVNFTGRLDQIETKYLMCTLYNSENDEDELCNINYCKPYLFPLSSMTEEQKEEYAYIVNYISSDDTENWKEGEFIYVEQFTQLMHFYHINHFDYRGLIPVGLANDASELNIY